MGSRLAAKSALATMQLVILMSLSSRVARAQCPSQPAFCPQCNRSISCEGCHYGIVCGPCEPSCGGPEWCASLCDVGATNITIGYMPIDMRLPCQSLVGGVACDRSIDVMRPVQAPKQGRGSSHCSVQVMPWSPFPCSYDPTQVVGIPGQPSNLCRNQSGDWFQQQLDMSHCTAAAAASGKQRSVVRAVLKLDFRIAVGRQWDQTYTLFIGGVAVAVGTTSEPTFRCRPVDKQWSVERDITHLSALLKSGSPVEFTITVGIDNEYYVPIWASVSIELYYQDVAVTGKWAQEVLPLIPKGSSNLGWTNIAGDGPSPPWPNATFSLPASVSQARTIIQAKLEVTPKQNACEEFWALYPSGQQSNYSQCNGVWYGNPYMELRVYVDGQLAGLQPIYFTIYTGGINPDLWTSIVSYKAYLLPSYTFDLGPWLSTLNSPEKAHTLTVEVLGSTGNGWVTSATLLLWRGKSAMLAGTAGGVDSWASNAGADIPPSNCEPLSPSQPKAAAARCTLAVGRRFLQASGSVAFQDGTVVHSDVSYKLLSYTNNISYNNTRGFLEANQTCRSAATWTSRSTKAATAGVAGGKSSVQDSFAMDTQWNNFGQFEPGGVWSHSFNFTGKDGSQRLRQRHYQRALMIDMHNDVCDLPPNITHTVWLYSVDERDLRPIVRQWVTTTWEATRVNSSNITYLG